MEADMARSLPKIGTLLLIAGTALGLVLAAHGQVPSANPRQQTNYFGSSGGNANDLVGGRCCSATLGSLLVAGAKKFVLSNNHVISAMGSALPGDPISQPGLFDNHCAPKRIVARFTLALRLADNVDAAIAELIDDRMDPKGEIIGIGLPSGQGVPPVVKMKVQKSGRSTGVTHGTIQSIAEIKVSYATSCKGAVEDPMVFKNQILIVGDGTLFADTGDSGSLVMDDKRQPVGLLFASGSTVVAANPIETVNLTTTTIGVIEQLSDKLGAELRFQTEADFKASSTKTDVSAKLVRFQTNADSKRSSTKTQEISSQTRKAFTAEENLFKHFLSEPDVVGVGVGEGTDQQPQLFVYVLKLLSPETLKRAEFNGTEYQGIPTQFVQTEPISAFPLNLPSKKSPASPSSPPPGEGGGACEN
jgi:hypothetical protein